MLAIFHKTFAHPPDELNSPASQNGTTKPKLPEETLNGFISRHPRNTFSMTFAGAAVLAYVRPDNPFTPQQRLFCGLEEIYCVFIGSLNNLCMLNRQYGLTKGSNEAMFIIEAYRTLRDRGPYPADQVVKDLEGTFAFVIYDSKAATVFVALGSDGGIELFWGIGGDGCVVICDDLEVIKASCAKSFAPFPPGFMFHSEGGLMSFEHPMNKVKAMQRTDSEGVICGADFKVDKYTRVNSLPRRGSEANWTEWDSHT
ncbi:stem-specific protein TSJT1 [Mercurialis annua]|uniref:stem-specific protein TSJT1 n=1 Tax=Mercurialis annua TaxID=3986 RepID=UPI00215E8D82|nr:stem-specific protein TSJT1 [Mercurialis annua]